MRILLIFLLLISVINSYSQNPTRIGVLIFYEEGYAGEPVDSLSNWYDAPINNHFGELYNNDSLKLIIITKMADLPVQILTEYDETFHETLDNNQNLNGLMIIYMNFFLAKYTRQNESAFKGDNFLIFRNGKYKIKTRGEHSVGGRTIPEWVQKENLDVFYREFYSVELCFFKRSSEIPILHHLIIDEMDSREPTIPNQLKLVDDLLDDILPQIESKYIDMNNFDSSKK